MLFFSLVSMSIFRFSKLIPCLITLGLILSEAQAAPMSGSPEPLSPSTGLSMHGKPALTDGFTHLPYVNPNAPKGGRLVLGLQGTFDSLNPFIVLGVAPDIAQKYVLQSLMMRSQDEPFTLYGLLAKSYEMPEDRSRIAFNLDERASFSDSQPVTAEDVEFSFRLLKESGKPYYRSSFSNIRSVKIISPHRIEFDMTDSQDRELPLIIATMPIFAKHTINEKEFSNTTLKPIIGSGPYVFDTIKPGETVSVKRRSDYWGTDLPVSRGVNNFDEIRYDFYRDSNSLFESFKAGLYDYRLESDATRWIGGYDIAPVKSGKIVKENHPIMTPKGMRAFVFNTRRALFSDIRVREALSYMFDFDWVNRNLYMGTLKRSNSYFNASDLSSSGTPANDYERALLSPYLSAIPESILQGRWESPSADGSGRDRTMAHKAIQLLKKAGWERVGEVLHHKQTGETFEFEFLVTSIEQERLAINYAASLKRLGIICTVRRVDDAQFWRRIADFNFDMIQWNWPVSASPGSEQRGRWSSAAAARTGSLNYAGVSSPAIDAMIDALLSARSREDFTASVRALDRLLLAGFYVVPLFYSPDQWVAYNSKLKHPAITPLQGVSIDSWWASTP